MSFSLSFPLPFLPSFFLLSSILILYLLRPLFFIFIARACSPLRRLPSPPSPSFFIGNLAQLADQENNFILHSWTEKYGKTFTYRGFLNAPRLFTIDPLALSYILGHAYDFPKPDFITDALAEMGAGHDGLITAHGDVHRRQRRIMNQAFSPSHIKSIMPIFREKAERLRDIFAQLADAPSPQGITDSQPASSRPVLCSTSQVPCETVNDNNSLSTHQIPQPPNSAATVDVLVWLCRATLDAIGEAGFGYSFHSLPTPGTDPSNADKTDNELARAFATMFSPRHLFSKWSILAIWFPFLKKLRPESCATQDAKATMQRIGTQLINERKAAHSGDIPKCDTPISRDILSVLDIPVAVHANMATSPSHALTHSEMLSQISTFLTAGHETTASALTWTLYALARAPAAQTRLRAALRTYDMTNFHAVLDLPILEHTVREALRLHAPVGSTMRVYSGSASECFVPLRHPVQVREPTWRRLSCWLPNFSYCPADGTKESGQWTLQCGIQLRHGDIITIPIQTINRATEFWGSDARDFRPERWADLPPAVKAIPGLYAHTLTFLNGNGGAAGNRSCIGYRFALVEIKIFLACLLRDLEFSIDDDVAIEKRVNIVTRPFVVSHPEMGSQMPLRVRRVPLDEVPRADAT